MNNKHRRWSRILPAIVSLLIAGVIGKSICAHKNTGKHPLTKSDSVVFPYRTIMDSNQNLVAYELHQRAGQGEDQQYTEYCAIIRTIDPLKDDYKTYCKSVVSDIIKTGGTDKIVVYIYDSSEAYALYEVDVLTRFRLLTEQESDLVDRHLIATFYGNRPDYYEDNSKYTLSYYEYANNGHSEHESYMP